MRKYFVFALALLVTSIITGGAHCGEEPDESALMTLEGTVTDVDLAGSSITVDGGIEMTFPITNKTQLKNDIYETQLSKLKTGDYVNVEYYQDETGVIKTTRVEVNYTKKDANTGWEEGAIYKGDEEW